jgi:hypothetical protein
MQKSVFFEPCPGCSAVYGQLERIAQDFCDGSFGHDLTDFTFTLKCQRCENTRRVMTPGAEEYLDFLREVFLRETDAKE